MAVGTMHFGTFIDATSAILAEVVQNVERRETIADESLSFQRQPMYSDYDSTSLHNSLDFPVNATLNRKERRCVRPR